MLNSDLPMLICDLPALQGVLLILVHVSLFVLFSIIASFFGVLILFLF